MTTYAKYLSPTYIQFTPLSGRLKNGHAVSGLPVYFNNHPEQAKENDYYPYEEEHTPAPIDDQKQWERSIEYTFDGEKIIGRTIYKEVLDDGTTN